MIRAAVVAFTLAAGCGGKRDDGSCAERTATLADRLQARRNLDEILRTAPPELRADIEAARAAEPGMRAVVFAERVERAVAGCADALAVMGDVAGAEDKEAVLRERLAPAIAACGCKASPEHLGGLVEAVLAPDQVDPRPQ